MSKHHAEALADEEPVPRSSKGHRANEELRVTSFCHKRSAAPIEGCIPANHWRTIMNLCCVVLGDAEHVCVMVHVWRAESVLSFHPVHPQFGGPDPLNSCPPQSLPISAPVCPIFNPQGHLLYFPHSEFSISQTYVIYIFIIIFYAA